MSIVRTTAALRYYWIFVAGMLASPQFLRFVSDPHRSAVLTLAAAAACFGALWVTSSAVRWLDRNGWQRLG